MLRDGGERREKRDRLEIGHVLRPPPECVEVAVPDRYRVGKKNEIEIGPLGSLGELNVVAKVSTRVAL